LLADAANPLISRPRDCISRLSFNAFYGHRGRRFEQPEDSLRADALVRPGGMRDNMTVRLVPFFRAIFTPSAEGADGAVKRTRLGGDPKLLKRFLAGGLGAAKPCLADKNAPNRGPDQTGRPSPSVPAARSATLTGRVPISALCLGPPAPAPAAFQRGGKRKHPRNAMPPLGKLFSAPEPRFSTSEPEAKTATLWAWPCAAPVHKGRRDAGDGRRGAWGAPIAEGFWRCQRKHRRGHWFRFQRQSQPSAQHRIGVAGGRNKRHVGKWRAAPRDVRTG